MLSPFRRGGWVTGSGDPGGRRPSGMRSVTRASRSPPLREEVGGPSREGDRHPDGGRRSVLLPTGGLGGLSASSRAGPQAFEGRLRSSVRLPVDDVLPAPCAPPEAAAGDTRGRHVGPSTECPRSTSVTGIRGSSTRRTRCTVPVVSTTSSHARLRGGVPPRTDGITRLGSTRPEPRSGGPRGRGRGRSAAAPWGGVCPRRGPSRGPPVTASPPGGCRRSAPS